MTIDKNTPVPGQTGPGLVKLIQISITKDNVKYWNILFWIPNCLVPFSNISKLILLVLILSIISNFVWQLLSHTFHFWESKVCLLHHLKPCLWSSILHFSGIQAFSSKFSGQQYKDMAILPFFVGLNWGIVWKKALIN